MLGDYSFAFSQFPIGLRHHFCKCFKGYVGLPSKRFAGVRRIAQEQIDFGGAEISRVDFHVLLPVEVEQAEYFVQEFADAVGFAGGDDEILRFVLLEHQPHGFDIIAGEAPVALGVEIAEVEFLLQAFFDAGGCAGDFSGDECFAAAGGFVVEEDAVAGVDVVGFAVVYGLPVAVDFGAGVGAAGVKGCFFGLRRFDDFAVHFAAGSLIEASRLVGVADGFEKIHRAQGVGLDGVDGLIEAYADVGLCAEVVDFVGLNAG